MNSKWISKNVRFKCESGWRERLIRRWKSELKILQSSYIARIIKSRLWHRFGNVRNCPKLQYNERNDMANILTHVFLIFVFVTQVAKNQTKNGFQLCELLKKILVLPAANISTLRSDNIHWPSSSHCMKYCHKNVLLGTRLDWRIRSNFVSSDLFHR